MIFKKKEYMKASLKDMMFFKGDNPYDITGKLDMAEVKFSNGEDVVMFFEYTPKSIREYGVVKDVMTGSSYDRFFGIKLNPGYLKCDEHNIVFIADVNQVLNVTGAEYKKYVSELKKNGMLSEYIEKVNNAYHRASLVKEETKEKTI